ncbi:DUF2550 family protein [Streptomyces fulvoviolaceus]|uniref:DUF2550 family protein n=1 Tax=Streptomyces fulvoviolaceus TaxID=285535 RepID=UPI0004C6F0DB|nr:DUF2550 family protein [Streptomyces fulvoviolaceus]
MLVALLAVLGVDLIVILAFRIAVLLRRRWVRRQTGAFKGAIRVVQGDVPGLSVKWRRGYGQWIRDILVWYRAPLLFRSEFVPADSLAGPDRVAESGEVKRLGKDLVMLSIAAENGARLELLSSANERRQAHGPFTGPRGDTAPP